MRFSIAAALAGLAAQAAAHGYIQTFKVDGAEYPGFRQGANNGDIIGWSFSTNDEGPVTDEVSTNMTCRHDGANAALSAKAQPGSKLEFFWTSDSEKDNPGGEWAESHHGPIFTYIAPCNGDCATVDKNTLKFLKVSETGLISGAADTTGHWATDQMRADKGWNSASLPENIAPGNYVVRNEIIALHRSNVNEPEFYMICANLEIGGSGSDKMEGGLTGPELYNRDMAIFGFSQYGDSKIKWEMPGPALYKGAAAGGSTPSSPSTPSTPSNPVAAEPENEEQEQEEEQEENAPGIGNGETIPDNSPATNTAGAGLPVPTGSPSGDVPVTNNPAKGNTDQYETRPKPPVVTQPELPAGGEGETEGDNSPTPGQGTGRNGPCKIGGKGKKDHGYGSGRFGSDRRHSREFA